MKQLLTILAIIFMVDIAYGEISKTDAEQKVGLAIKQIYQQVDSSQNNVGVTYAKAKLYVTDHSEQLVSDDKIKLNGLQTEISNWNAKGESLKTYIKTNFSGIQE